MHNNLNTFCFRRQFFIFKCFIINMEVNFLTFKPQTSLKKSCMQNPIRFKGNLEADTFEKSEKQPVKRTRSQILADKHAREVAFYNEKLELNPRTAFLYNPDLSPEEKDKLLAESEGIYTFRELADELGINYKVINAWTSNGLLQSDETEKYSFIDAKFPKNEEFINGVKQKFQNTASASKLVSEFSISSDAMKKHIKAGTIKPVGYSEPPKSISYSHDFLIDLNDETNIETLKNYYRRPKPSKKYLKSDEKQIMVPVHYLQKLGYGDARSLARMVQSGSLEGKIEKVEAKPGEKPKLRVFVDISKNVRGEELLRDLRKLNSKTVSPSDFAKDMGMLVRDIKEAIVSGEIEIVDEYIFSEDKNEILIDKTNPKNIAFMDKKFFEEELIRQQRAEKRKERLHNVVNPMNSLRMRLIWSMCPSTSEIASVVARGDAMASKVIAKKSNGQELSDIEDRKYRAYCKEFWNRAGSVEFDAARAKAREIMEQYKALGIDGVEDENARKVIEEFLKETKGLS